VGLSRQRLKDSSLAGLWSLYCRRESRSGGELVGLRGVVHVLYQPNFGGSLAAYKVLQNGALHFLNMTDVGQVMSPETLLVDASGTFLFAVGASASDERAPPQVSSFQVDLVTGNLIFARASQAFNSLNYYFSLAAARETSVRLLFGQHD
jgi:hypothetical protein